MPQRIKNPVDLLYDLTKYPAAIEARLPEAAPKISRTLTDIAGRIPALPDFPVEIPVPPAPPAPPAPEEGVAAGLRRFIRGAEVAEMPPPPPRPVSPAQRIVPLVYE